MGDKGITKRQIGDGVILHTESIKTPPATYKYNIESVGFHKVTFTFNFEGSVNFGLVDCPYATVAGKPLVATVVANPFEVSPVVICRQLDVHKGGSLSMSMSWLIEQPDGPIVESYLAEKASKMEATVAKTKTVFHPELQLDPSAEKLNALCESNGTHFVDCTFAPLANSLYAAPTINYRGDAVEAEPIKKNECIVWRRPSEFITDGKPIHVFEGKIEPDDIKQGQLGDCWLMCSLSSIAEFPRLVEDLFITKQTNPNGVYMLRICKGGVWRTIVLDDYFPCKPEAGPVYSKANANELWVLLLEKAFAKIHGSYAAIKSGWAFEAMMDLTGAPFKDIRFSNKEVAEQIANGQLWEYLCECDRQNFILSCSTRGVDKCSESGNRTGTATGLVPGHAYTLLTAVTTSTGDRLAKLRNPWGSLEWTGDWSDNCPKWTPALKQELGHTAGDDGTFWISFEDLVVHFTGVNVCMCRNPEHNAEPWVEFRQPIEYKFSTRGAGVINVDMFVVTVHETCDLFASVHQPDQRIIGSLPYIDVGVVILQSTGVGTFRHVSSSGTSVERQNQFEAKNLVPGEYIVIPTSTGSKLQSYLQRLNRPTVEGDYRRHGAIVFHSTKTFDVKPIAFDAIAYEEAMELPVIEAGTPMDLFGDGSVILYTRKAGYSGISYVAKNTTEEDAILLTLDLSGSSNIISNRLSLAADVMVPPNEAKVMHHIFPDDEHKDWSAGWSCNARWLTEEEANDINLADIQLTEK
jgi:calpain-15